MLEILQNPIAPEMTNSQEYYTIFIILYYYVLCNYKTMFILNFRNTTEQLSYKNNQGAKSQLLLGIYLSFYNLKYFSNV